MHVAATLHVVGGEVSMLPDVYFCNTGRVGAGWAGKVQPVIDDKRPVSANGPVGPGDPGIMARTLAPSTLAWVAVACALSVAGLLTAVGDTRGEKPLSLTFMGASMLPTAFAVLQPLWRPSARHSAIFDSLQRCVLVPLLVAPLITLITSVAILLPAVNERLENARNNYGWHYYFPSDSGSPLFQVAVLGGLTQIILSMLLGLALTVLIVIPVVAFSRPREFAAANMLDTAPEHEATSSVAGKIFAVMLVLVFAVPALIVFGSKEASANTWQDAFGTWLRVFEQPYRYWGDAMWVIGILLIPVGIVTVVLVRIFQRPDRKLRAQAKAMRQ